MATKTTKNNTFISAKQQLARTSRIFVHLFLISRARFILGRWAQHNFFSFSIKPRYGHFGFNPRKFRQHLANQMKLNKVDEVWNSANSLFEWRFRFVVIQGPVVGRPTSINPRLNFNLGFFFFFPKAFSRIIFSLLFRASNHQIVGKKNKTEFAS